MSLFYRTALGILHTISLFTLQEYEKVAQNLTHDTKALIVGAPVDFQSGNRFDSISPGAGKALTSVTSCDTEDLDKAVAIAKAAFDSGIWSEMTPADRKSILFRFAASILNILPGSGSVIGNALANHPDVNLITFTGSTEVGRNLLNCSGSSNIKRVLLELGGKNPCVVTDEIEDLDFAAQEIVSGALWNMGENCTQNSRLIIQKSIKNKLLPKILKEVETWKVGNPLDPANRHGAIIEKPHMQKILDYIEIGKNEGADLIYGGTQILEETGGNFIQPSVFDNCNQSMRIVREEIFGPVFAIETFDTLEEGIAMANDTEYGLQASIWSDNLNTVQKLFSKIQAGVISVNHFSEGDITTPFGGFKQSGFMGRDKSIWANKQYTELKSVYIKTR